MTTLGDDIRAQATVTEGLGRDLATHARTVRRTTADTDWTSSAADLCRARLGVFARVIDGMEAACHELAQAITMHAASVEAQELAAALIPMHGAPGVRVSPSPPPAPTCLVTPSRRAAPSLVGPFPLGWGGTR